jgi:hypothetical protein
MVRWPMQKTIVKFFLLEAKRHKRSETLHLRGHSLKREFCLLNYGQKHLSKYSSQKTTFITMTTAIKAYKDSCFCKLTRSEQKTASTGTNTPLELVAVAVVKLTKTPHKNTTICLTSVSTFALKVSDKRKSPILALHYSKAAEASIAP